MKKFFLIVFVFLCSCVFAAADNLDSYFNKLNDEEKVFQLFLVNIEGNKTYRPVEFLEDGSAVVPGGVLLFSYNIGNTAEELVLFLDSINDYCLKNKITPPYVAVDQEGGDVNRLRGITSALPSCKKIAENNSAEDAKRIYANQARQMRLLGIHMNLAPVAEPLLDYNKDFLGSRSFGTIPESVVYGRLCVGAYEENGVASVVKHFPGNSNTDPHTGLPVISLSKEEFENNFLLPFAFILNAAEPECILMSHAIVKGYDENTPACLSSFWIDEVLKNTMNYNGLVISDDIFMGALADNGFPPEVAVVKAIDAGVDVLMLSEKKFLNAARILIAESKRNPEFKNKIDAAVKRVLAFKNKYGLLNPEDKFNLMPVEERVFQFNQIYKEGQNHEK